MRVAIIGLGTMGRAAAGRIVGAGHGVTAHDPAPGARAVAEGLGLSFTPDVSEAVREAALVLLFLPGPAEIFATVNAIADAAPSSAVIVDHSTADPETARLAAERLGEWGIGWIDAPVLGRPTAVGNWALPAGATPGALDLARPVFDSYAAHVFEAGGPGAGHTIKLLNQMMFGAINAMTAEMMATGDRLGVAPGRLYEIITASQAGTVSNLFRELGQRIAEDRYDAPTFSVRLLEKDVRLGVEMARKAGLDPVLGRVVAAMNEDAIKAGFGAQDSAVMWKVPGNGRD